MKKRANRCLPNHHILVNNPDGYRMNSHDSSQIAFGMATLDVGNPKTNRNIDDFGGVPFYNHLGNHCHRGVDPFKKFHNCETAKRVSYR